MPSLMQPCQHSLLTTEDVRTWLAQVRKLDHCEVMPLALAHSQAWALQNGVITHQSGRFFNIVGLTWTLAGMQHWQPFIEQREVGTLGFIARRSEHGFDLLVQAKTEPGNVGLTHLGPTCQATASNRDCVHGGEAPPYADYFVAPANNVVSDSLQSEQGTRFLGKHNQNILMLETQVQTEVIGTQHRWLPFEVFKQLLLEDFRVNTDARSVLYTTDWARLLGRLPFQGDDAFSQDLHASFCAPIRPAVIDHVHARLQAIRATAPQVTVCALQDMPGWQLATDHPVILTNGHLSVRHIRVHAQTREVSDWDQPIVDSHAEQAVDLDCGRQNGLLQFALRPCWEPGLSAGAELAPTRMTALSTQTRVGEDVGEVRLQVRQSDEGGRFYQDVACYRIVDVGETRPEGALIWLTLAEIKALLPLGLFNNEARSALSLLLSLA